MKKTHLLSGAVSIIISILSFNESKAQFTLGAQLRTRTELRDGQGSPLPLGNQPAVFTSQRSRLSAGFTGYRFKLGITVQDVRVWGQDVSTINRTTTQDNNGLMLHEAWAEVMLLDTVVKNQSLNLKVGRQELVYDDGRLLGNLNWLQQARRHDAAILKYENKSWMLHVGGAFNQNKEMAAGTIYTATPPGAYTANTNGGSQYKGLEFLYLGKKLKTGNLSFLFVADQFNKFRIDTVAGAPVKTWTQGIYNRATTGLFFTNQFNKLSVTASAYYQFGSNANNQTLSAELFSAAFQYALCKEFSAGAGVDYTTGGLSSNGKTSKAFDPLYGAPHAFWGLMDYFYAANGFGNKGLQDYYIKTKLKAGPKFLLTADVHEFFSASDVAGADTRRFGTEADLTGTLALTKIISFEAGYSHFWNTNTLTSPAVKNITNAQSNSNWAYLMIIIKPEFLLK
jgi:hypothetical protein